MSKKITRWIIKEFQDAVVIYRHDENGGYWKAISSQHLKTEHDIERAALQLAGRAALWSQLVGEKFVIDCEINIRF